MPFQTGSQKSFHMILLAFFPAPPPIPGHWMDVEKGQNDTACTTLGLALDMAWIIKDSDCSVSLRFGIVSCSSKPTLTKTRTNMGLFILSFSVISVDLQQFQSNVSGQVFPPIMLPFFWQQMQNESNAFICSIITMLKAGDAMVKTLKGIRSRQDKKTRQISSVWHVPKSVPWTCLGAHWVCISPALQDQEKLPAVSPSILWPKESIGVDQAKGAGVGGVK